MISSRLNVYMLHLNWHFIEIAHANLTNELSSVAATATTNITDNFLSVNFFYSSVTSMYGFLFTNRFLNITVSLILSLISSQCQLPSWLSWYTKVSNLSFWFICLIVRLMSISMSHRDLKTKLMIFAQIFLQHSFIY